MAPDREPDLNKYFRKILKSIFYVLLWLMAGITAGIYYEWAFFGSKSLIFPVMFYGGMIFTGVLLVRYLTRLWK